jgi:hypothetical protein
MPPALRPSCGPGRYSQGQSPIYLFDHPFHYHHSHQKPAPCPLVLTTKIPSLRPCRTSTRTGNNRNKNTPATRKTTHSQRKMPRHRSRRSWVATAVIGAHVNSAHGAWANISSVYTMLLAARNTHVINSSTCVHNTMPARHAQHQHLFGCPS